MQLKVTGRNLKSTDALRDYVDKRLEKIRRHIPRIQSVEAVFRREGVDHAVDLRFNASSIKMVVSGCTPDMYTSIDEAIAKLERATIREKERRIQTPRQRVQRARKARQSVPVEPVDEDEEGPAISKVTTLEVKPMSIDEAVLQLNTMGFAFFMFRDSDDQLIKVVYRRSDKTIGLIESDAE